MMNYFGSYYYLDLMKKIMEMKSYDKNFSRVGGLKNNNRLLETIKILSFSLKMRKKN